MKKLLSTLTLFGSLSTLLCCALPALLVSLGLGATVAGLVTAVPQLVWLSERKDALFLFCGLMLAAAGVLQWRARRLACPIDPKLADACRDTRGWSGWVYGLSLVLFLVGVFISYLAPRLFF